MAIWNVLGNTYLGSDTSTVTFSSISGSYQHLCVKAVCRNTTSTANLKRYHKIQVGNGSVSTSTSDYSETVWYANAGAVTGTTTTSGTNGHVPAYYMNNDGSPADTFGYLEVWFFDYSSTSKKKQIGVAGTMNAGTSTTSSERNMGMASGNYLGTAAIDIITFTVSADNYKTGCEFTLYGVNGAD